jgi:hypothetical protein
MEVAMTPMTETIAAWIGRQRHKFAADRELDAIGPAEVSVIARDLGITSPQLRVLARQRSGLPELLSGMFSVLGMDLRRLEVVNAPMARDMEAVCALCDSKRRCRTALKSGTAAGTFHEFCPNTSNLEVLAKEKYRALHPSA